MHKENLALDNLQCHRIKPNQRCNIYQNRNIKIKTKPNTLDNIWAKLNK